MINTNCAYNKFNDLMGIHKVIFDSLIDGKSFEESVSDVKSKYLHRYYGKTLSGLGNDVDTITTTLSDIASAIYLTSNVIAEANNIEDFINEIDITDSFKIINDIVGEWQAQAMSNAGVIVKTNVESTNGVSVNSQEVVEDENELLETDKDYILSGNIIAEPVNVIAESINNGLDLTENYFKSARTAKNKLIRTIYNDLFKASFIDLSDVNAKPVRTAAEIDANIKKYKAKLFNVLYPNEELYVNGITTPDFAEKLGVFQSLLQQMNSNNGVYVQDIMTWAHQNGRAIKQYYAFITLKHFDDLIKLYGAGFVKVRPNLMNNYAESLSERKYVPANMSKLRSGHTNVEIISVAQETTEIFRTFIETTPIINLEGKRTQGFLKPDQIYYNLSKLKSEIDKSDVTRSIKNAIIGAIEKYFDGTSKQFNSTEIKTLLSLYQRVYMDKESNKRLKANINLTSVISNIEGINENSLSMAYRSHFPGKHDINLLEVVSGAINKVDLMNYGEVSFDHSIKEYRSVSLQNKLNDREFNMIKASSSKTLVATTQSVNKWKTDLNIDVNDENVIFKFNNLIINYNIAEQSFTDKDNNVFDFESINRPEDVGDLNIEGYSSNYPEYIDLLNKMSVITGQPLTSLNYEIPQIMNDRSGSQHIKDLLVIAGNLIYTSHLTAEYLNDIDNMSLSEIRNALGEIPGLLNNFKFKSLWNGSGKHFNLDFGDLSFQAIRNLADTLNEIYGSNIKSTTLNAQGNAIPTYTPNRMINDVVGIVKLARNSEHIVTMPLANNMFVKNLSDDLLLGVEVRLSVRDSKGKVTSSSSLSDIETVNYDIFNDYLEQKLNPNENLRNPKFQATNYADKSTHAALRINGNAEIEIREVVKRYRDFSMNDYRNHFFDTQESYFNNLWTTLAKDYQTLFESGILHQTYLNDSTLLKLAMNEEIYGEIDYDTLNEEYKGDLLEKEVEVFNKLFKINNEFLNGMNSDFDIDYANEVFSLISEKTFVKAMREADIDVVKTISYELDAVTGAPVVNRTLKHLLNSFGNGRVKHANKMKRDFLNSLKDIGFTLDYLNPVTLTENPLITRMANAWNVSKFKNEKLGTYDLYKGNLNGAFEMNPMLEQYLWEYNLNSQNFQNLTVGSILGHPAKIKKENKESDEAFNDRMVSARTVAMFKRMVIHQATYQPYNLNQINGIPFYNKVAYIKDPTSNVFTPYGNNDKVDITDGSTFNLVLLTILQNNSLLDQKVGYTQKSIGGSINKKYNSAELLKHAAHSITNERLNNENEDAKYSWMNLVKKGLDIPFNINKRPIKIDISKDFNGKEIKLNDIFADVAYFDPIMQQYLNIVKIEPSANWKTNNEYNVYLQDMDTLEILDPRAVTINSLYDLWQVLGGKNSISYEEGSYNALSNRAENLKSYTPSNRSWEALAEFTNRVGVWYDDKAIENILADPQDSAIEIKELHNLSVINPEALTVNHNFETSVASQKTVIQPLKHSFIGQFTFSSGQKVGIINENDNSVMRRGDNTPLSYASVDNTHTGVQLNPDHETDDSEVTESTQKTNTLSFNGDAPEYANGAYEGIAMYIDNNLSKILPEIDQISFSPQAKYKLYNSMLTEFINGITENDSANMSGTIALAVKKELDAYKEDLKRLIQASPNSEELKTSLTNLEAFDKDGFKLPFSDSNIYNAFATTVANYFTQKGIRRKTSGISAVVSPYSNFMGVRNIVDPTTGKTTVMLEPAYRAWRSNIISNNEDPAMYEKTEIGLHNKDIVELFDTVINENGVKIVLDTPSKYYAYKASPSNFVKLNLASRDLKPTMHKWKIKGLEGFTNYYDLPVSKLSFLNTEIQSTYKKLMSLTDNKLKGIISDSGKSNYELKTKGTALDNLVNVYNELKALLAEHDMLVTASGLNEDIQFKDIELTLQNSQFQITLTDNNKTVNKIDFEFNNDIKRLLKNTLTDLLGTIHHENRAPMPVTLLNIPDALNKYQILTDFGDMSKTISAQDHYNEYLTEYPNKTVNEWYAEVKPMVKVDELTVIPGEIMMPAIFKSKYNLSSNDNLNDINEEFFNKKLNHNALPHTLVHDFYVRSLQGEHLYVLLKDSTNHKKLDLRPVKLNTLQVKQPDGTYKTYKLDDEDNIQYELGYENLYQSMVDGTMRNYVIVDTIDDLAKLGNITKGNNSSYKNIVPNFQAGIPVAMLGVELLKLNKDRRAEKFEKILKRINKSTNNTKKIASSIENKELLSEELLLEVYDKEWATETVKSIQDSLPTIPVNYIARAEDKLKHVENYLRLLEREQTPENKNKIIAQINQFKNSDIQSNAAKIKNLTNALKTTQSDIDESLALMAEMIYNGITNTNAKHAKRIYSSFVVQLGVTAARIPGQALQSFMGQTIVGFIHSEENLAFVSPFHMYITGEDFDIDKAYISAYSTDDNGVLVGWGKMFNYDSPETLSKSLELPVPNKVLKTLVTTPSKNVINLSIEDVNNIKNYLETKTDFNAYVNTMKKLKGFNEIFLLPSVTTEDSQYLMSHLNDYFSSEFNGRFAKEAALNILEYNTSSASNDIRNINHVMSPMTFGAAGEAAKNSKKGADFNKITPFNPVNIATAKNNNMIGKDVIGISASVGLKVYSVLSNAFINIKSKTPVINVNRKIYDYEMQDGELVKTNERIQAGIAGINYTRNIDEFMKYYESVVYMGSPITETELAELEEVRIKTIRHLRYRGDVALDLSGVLAAATDNAKELILARINAGPDTVAFYLAGLMYGYSFESLAALMTSPEAEAMIKLTNTNLYIGHKVSVTSALRQLRTNVLNPKNYFNFNTISVIVDQIKKTPTSFNIVKSTFGSEISGNEIEKALKNPYVFFERFIKGGGDLKSLNIVNASKIEGEYSKDYYKPKQTASPEEIADLLEYAIDSGAMDVEGIESSGDQDYDDYSAYMADMYASQTEGFDPSGGSVYKPKDVIIQAEVAFNRYLREVDKYIPKNLNKGIIKDLQDFNTFSADFEVLGKMLSINQSIKITDGELYKYFKSITDHTNKLTTNGNEESFPNYATPLNDLNDFNNFVSDSEYRQKVISSYQGDGVNILAVLANSDHFFKMFTLAVKTDVIKNAFSTKNKLIRSIESKLRPTFRDVTLNVKQFNSLSKFAEEVIIANFLNNTNITIQLKAGDSDDTNEILLTDKVISLNTPKDRQAYVNWFEKVLINDLKSGRLRDVDGEYLPKAVINLRENSFIQRLTIDKKKDPITKRSYTFYKLPINMTGTQTEDEKVLIDTITGAFASLRNYEYNGKNLLDLLYLYNLIVNKNKSTGQSFNRLFDAVSQGFNNNSIMSQFIKFESALDWAGIDLEEGTHYHMQDVVKKGLVPVVDVLPLGQDYDTLPEFISVELWDDQINELTTKIYNNTGTSWEELATLPYTEKVININNAKSNLSDLLVNTTEKIKVNNLNKFLENMELKQLECK